MENLLHINEYYTCLEHLLKVYDKHSRKNKFTGETQEALIKWQQEMRELLRGLIGLDMMEECELQPKQIEHKVLPNGIIREKIVIQVEPEVFMPFYVLSPIEPVKQGKRQCVIAAPGHMSAGKLAVAGVDEINCVKEKIEYFNYDYGMQLALLGYTVLCPDIRGFGERREAALQKDDENAFLGSTCFQLEHMAIPLGQTVVGMLTWDLMRLIDYIETKEGWNVEHIGCVGFSGGGMQTLWLSALDERIQYSIISGYMYGYKDSLLKLNGNCSCNYVPHLWKHVDMGDIGALIAPRPVMIQSGRVDHLNGERGVINVIEQVEIMKEAYKLLGAEMKIHHAIYEGGHKWYSQDVEGFLGKLEYKK